MFSKINWFFVFFWFLVLKNIKKENKSYLREIFLTLGNAVIVWSTVNFLWKGPFVSFSVLTEIRKLLRLCLCFLVLTWANNPKISFHTLVHLYLCTISKFLMIYKNVFGWFFRRKLDIMNAFLYLKCCCFRLTWYTSPRGKNIQVQNFHKQCVVIC